MRNFLCILIVVCVTLFHFHVNPAVAVPDYAQERENSGASLDLINVEEAYALGYTGVGLTLGLFDSAMRLDHPEVAGKSSAFFEDNPHWASVDHGSHVGGIMAGARDGYGMHGVAFDASIYNVAHLDNWRIFYYNSGSATFTIDQLFEAAPQARVFNHSWGSTTLTISLGTPGAGGVSPVADLPNVDFDRPFKSNFLADLVTYARKNPQIVYVFASANFGYIGPSVEPIAPRYEGLDFANFIAVGSLNSAEIQQSNDGRFLMTPLSVSTFSNLAAGAERWTVFASGSYINSLDPYGNTYKLKSGTSMAAPAVSGALGLVQQAYPWMTGKQLADAVLTTTNTNFDTPEYILSHRAGFYSPTVVFHYIDKPAPNLTQDEAKAMVEALYENAQQPDEDIAKLLVLIDLGRFSTATLSWAQVFGRGILDVGKAVQGIALLDVNRLSASHAVSVPELSNTPYALEVFDTQNYDAVFNNDMAEQLWDDSFHHEEYRTTGSNGNNANALALAGLYPGMIKQGTGTLMLLGNNTYSGPTIVEEGTVGLMPRADGSGGSLKSSVIVRNGGTFYSAGGTVGTDVYNDGHVTLASAPTTSLTVNGAFTQTSAGTLRVEVTDEVHSGDIKAGTASIDGALQLVLGKDFYEGKTQLQYELFTSGTHILGNFTSVDFWDSSITLEASLAQQTGNAYTLRIHRPQNAYAQYANTVAGYNVGIALSELAFDAKGDMQTLLATLDFSGVHGDVVQEALNELSTQSQNQLIQASIAQQSAYNTFLLQQMLGGLRVKNTADTAQKGKTGFAAGQNFLEERAWHVWGSVLGSYTSQGAYDNYAGWDSSSIGIMAGADYVWQQGVSAGFHMGLASRRTMAQAYLESETNTQSFSFGFHGLVAPSSWNGWYLMGQARVGFEKNDQQRTVSFADYQRVNTSYWTDFVGSGLIGGGKYWQIHDMKIGPVAWLEYTFLQRPSITEDHGPASALYMEKVHYDSLRTGLALHMGYEATETETFTVYLNGLLAWRHELLDGSISTEASFRDYQNVSFIDETPLRGRNTLLARGNVRFQHTENFYMEVHIGAEVTDAYGSSVNYGINAGYTF